MKNVGAFVLLLLLSCVPAFCQWTTKARVSVPFEFEVNGTVLPAGQYEIREDTQIHTIQIWNADTAVSAISINNDVVLPESSWPTLNNLKFTYDGKRHVLHQITLDGDNHVNDLRHGTEIAELVQRPQ